MREVTLVKAERISLDTLEEAAAMAKEEARPGCYIYPDRIKGTSLHTVAVYDIKANKNGWIAK